MLMYKGKNTHKKREGKTPTNIILIVYYINMALIIGIHKNIKYKYTEVWMEEK